MKLGQSKLKVRHNNIEVRQTKLNIRQQFLKVPIHNLNKPLNPLKIKTTSKQEKDTLCLAVSDLFYEIKSNLHKNQISISDLSDWLIIDFNLFLM